MPAQSINIQENLRKLSLFLHSFPGVDPILRVLKNLINFLKILSANPFSLNKLLIQTCQHPELQWFSIVLINLGVSLDGVDAQGNTALHQAAMTNNINIVNHLIARGADLNSTNVYGNMPMHLATLQRHLMIIEALKLAGASTTQRNVEHQTPIDIAYNSPNYDVLTAVTGNPSRPFTPLHQRAMVNENRQVQCNRATQSLQCKRHSSA